MVIHKYALIQLNLFPRLYIKGVVTKRWVPPSKPQERSVEVFDSGRWYIPFIDYFDPAHHWRRVQNFGNVAG